MSFDNWNRLVQEMIESRQSKKAGEKKHTTGRRQDNISGDRENTPRGYKEGKKQIDRDHTPTHKHKK